MSRLRFALPVALFLLLSACATAQTVRVTIPADVRPLNHEGKPAAAPGPVDGRLLVLLSNDASDEPRNQISNTLKTQMVFGVTLDGAKPGSVISVGDNAYGYPVKRLSQVPPGEYNLQVVLNLYQTFHRADGKTVKLAPDRGEGQHWNIAPYNPYSTPRKVKIDGKGTISVTLDKVIPAIPDPVDTKYIRRLRIQSPLLSKFWGAPVYLKATVLVPEGFDQHPEARFPLMIFHDHFDDGFPEFRTEPPDPNLKPDYSDRFHLAGYNRIQQQEAYKFYQQWTAKDFPRFLVLRIQHANPYYDDSYAVDSANLGPYGEAIETELLPAVEKQFHGLGQGWARFVYGGSTGGWEALAVQLFYPDHYNGAFVACPDPVDFHAYTNINLYDQPNAFFLQGATRREEQPAMRNYIGQALISQREINQYELALGDHGRSGEQYDIWQAVYGPVGEDGYPAPIFDKETGVIDKKVAEYWREHYDLNAKMQREWPQLHDKLDGKLHLYVGYDDNYVLNAAVYLMEDFLKSANPPVQYEVAYGPKAEHCWNGDPNLPNAYSRLHYETQYLPKILDRITKSAPKGADLVSWRY